MNILNKLIFILVFSFSSSSILYSFNSVKKLESYALYNLPTAHPNEPTNFLSPRFSSFYKEKELSSFQSFFRKILETIQIRKPSPFSIETFMKKLETVTKKREAQGYTGKFVLKVNTQAKKQFIIFGSLYGELKSLTRSLAELVKMGILSDNFKINDPDHYIIFNGNTIDYSPYNTEILSTILSLLEKNPDNVFYTKGTHEEKNSWLNYTFKEELRSKARHSSVSFQSLQKKVNRFFNTLPRAIYLQGENQQQKPEFARVSFYGKSDLLLKENRFGKALKEAHKTTSMLIQIERPEKKQREPEISCILQGNTAEDSPANSNGLLMLNQVEGTHLWTLFSSPSIPYQHLHGFFNSTFLLLSTEGPINNWNLTLFHSDMRKKIPFKTESYHALSGGKIKQEKKAFYIGCTGDQTKHFSLGFIPILKGMHLRINKANKESELKNYFLKFLVHDDLYEPQKTRAYLKKVKDKVSIFLGSGGTPTLETYFPLLKEKSIALFFPSTGGNQLRSSSLKNVINFAPSYNTEALVLTEYAIKKLHKKRIALIYQNDGFGRAGLDGVEKAIQNRNNINLKKVPYRRSNPDLSKVVSEVKDYNPEVIIFFANFSIVKRLIVLLGANYLASKKIFGPFLLHTIRPFLKSKGLRITTPRRLPPLNDESIQIVREYKDAKDKNKMQDQFQTYEDIGFEGYLYADLLITAIKSVKKPENKEELLSFFESMKNKNYKGLNLSFSPTTRTLSQTLWILSEENERAIPIDLSQRKEPIANSSPSQ
jgi:branched-chain amino acid transport system substrate-binding protein